MSTQMTVSGSTPCRGCAHPPHLGPCLRRNGTTAYQCPCTADTPPAITPLAGSCRRALERLARHQGLELRIDELAGVRARARVRVTSPASTSDGPHFTREAIAFDVEDACAIVVLEMVPRPMGAG